MSIKTYSELITLPTFEERYKYLRVGGVVGEETFGSYRYWYQRFLQSTEYKRFRRSIIVRDKGCDLGIDDREIQGVIILHHINPVSIEDVINHNTDVLLDPENAICVSHMTHEAIHYGDEDLLIAEPIERSAFDTCPWKMKGDYNGL